MDAHSTPTADAASMAESHKRARTDGEASSSSTTDAVTDAATAAARVELSLACLAGVTAFAGPGSRLFLTLVHSSWMRSVQSRASDCAWYRCQWCCYSTVD